MKIIKRLPPAVRTKYLKLPKTDAAKLIKTDEKLRKRGLLKPSEMVPIKREQRNRNRFQFVHWVKKKYPDLYSKVIQKIGAQPQVMNGLGDTGDSWFSNFTGALTSLGQTVLQYKAQKKLMDMQMQRAQSGLPPLQAAEYAPAIKVVTEAGPETRRVVTETGNKLMIPLAIGGGLLVVALLMRKKR